MHINDVVTPYFLFNGRLEGVDLIKCWTNASSLKLNNSHRMPVFHQDGARFYNTRAALSPLYGMFPNFGIKRYRPPGWVARSLSLNSLDVFLWGFVKYQSYCTSLPSLPKHKTKNDDRNRNCKSDILSNDLMNLENRFHVVVQESHGHKEH